MKSLIIGFMHKKTSKRVLRTVKAISKFSDKVEYLFWSDSHSDNKSKQIGNIKYVPFYCPANSFGSLQKMKFRKNYEKQMLNYLDRKVYDLVYFHHYPSIYVSDFFKLFLNRAKIITDFHEYTPDDYLLGVSNIPLKLKRFLGQRLFSKLIKYSDAGVFVSKWMIDKARKLKDMQYFWLPNYGDKTIAPKPKTERQKEIVVVGKTFRKMKKELDLVKYLNQMNFQTTVIGFEGKKYEELNTEPFLPYEEMVSRISKSAFGLISYDYYIGKNYISNNYIHSMPNKFFDYICAGLPVIIDEKFEDMRKFIENDGIGIYIDRDLPSKNANKIFSSWNNQYDGFLENIKQVQQKYMWDNNKENSFLNFIQNVMK